MRTVSYHKLKVSVKEIKAMPVLSYFNNYKIFKVKNDHQASFQLLKLENLLR